MLLEEERLAVVGYGRAMVRAGLTSGTGGNLSCCERARGLMAISPRGVPYDVLKPRDVVVVDLAGTPVDGANRPVKSVSTGPCINTGLISGGSFTPIRYMPRPWHV